VIRKIFQVGLGSVAVAYIVGGALAIAGLLGNAHEGNAIWKSYAVFGGIFVVIGIVAAVLVWLATKRWWTLILAAIVLCAGDPVLLVSAFWIGEETATVHRLQLNAGVNSGRNDFGDDPALLAVAQAIAANNQEAIRAAAKSVPNLNAAGRDGATLLCWTVQQSWQRRELVEAIKTLLSLGADPNYTNGKDKSFALGYSVHGPAEGLRAMLDAGGNPNALNAYGWPLIFMHFKLGYYEDEERKRIDLLLDRGADINAIVPEEDSDSAGYTLVLYTTKNGKHVPTEYACAEYFLERGADPNRVAPDGMTLAKMLTLHRDQFAAEKQTPPAQFTSLWKWAEAHGIFAKPQ
jgi:drug/metabolite transporter superfamily protein YnfA